MRFKIVGRTLGPMAGAAESSLFLEDDTQVNVPEEFTSGEKEVRISLSICLERKSRARSESETTDLPAVLFLLPENATHSKIGKGAVNRL